MKLDETSIYSIYNYVMCELYSSIMYIHCCITVIQYIYSIIYGIYTIQYVGVRIHANKCSDSGHPGSLLEKL